MPIGVEYSEDVACIICDRIASGESVRSISRSPGMPHEVTIYRWVADDRDGFRARYTRARESQAERMADEILEIADDGSNDWMEFEGKTIIDHEYINRSRLRVDSRKWLMARLAPKKWGDKQDINQTISANVTTKIEIELVKPEPRK